MIVGIGIDMVEIARMERLHSRFGERFARHILTRAEMAAVPKNAAPYLAARFAAKEALVKALGTGFALGITPEQIEILPDSLGKPKLTLSGEARRRADLLGAADCHISLTHERLMALAVVILES